MTKDLDLETLFGNLPDEYHREFLDKHQFRDLAEIPACRKYTPPTGVNFTRPGEFNNNGYETATLDLMKVYQADPHFMLSLHPARFDLAKRAVAAGEMITPWLERPAGSGSPVVDGRHRIIAMLILGLKTADFVFKSDEADWMSELYA